MAAPKPGVLLKMLGALALAAPNAGGLPAPKAGVLAPPKLNAELLAAPKAGVEAALAPKAGMLKPPNNDGALPPLALSCWGHGELKLHVLHEAGLMSSDDDW